MRIVAAREVRTILTMPRAIDLMRHAMTLVARGQTQQPLRQALFLPDKSGLLGLMPGYIAQPELLGIKVISVFAKNFAAGLPSHQGVVLLFETQHGAPIAMIDAREITAIRTAAATAVATEALARRDAKTLVLFGYGEQAETHFEALTQVRSFERVLVWGRDLRKASAFAAKFGRAELPVEAIASAEDAARKGDVICTLTAAIDPVLFGRWLAAGSHVNAVGAGTPAQAELDTDAVRRCRMFADYKDSALALGGEFLRAKAAGAVGDDHIIGSIGDVLIGKVKGRSTQDELTLFKSLGMAAEDLVAADFVLREAEQRGVGQVVDW